MGGETHCESNVFCSRTPHSDPARFRAGETRPELQRSNN